MEIKGYQVKGQLKTTNSGFSKWGFAQKNGKAYFIKEFIDPVYPDCTDVLESSVVERKKKICREYENRSNCLYREINACSDGNLVYIEEFFRCGSHYYLTMEKVSAVSMSLVRKMPEEDRIRICKALIHCIGRMHQRGIVHADIKLDNIMFRELPSGKIAGKVIDFDNSFWENEPPDPEEEVHGDPVYMAPETFRMMETEEGRLTTAIDVFALGLVFHQIFTGELPDFDHSKYDYPFEAVLHGAGLSYSTEIPELWRNMIILMTEADCKKRISLADAEKLWKYPAGNPADTLEHTGANKDAFVSGSYFSAAGDLK